MSLIEEVRFACDPPLEGAGFEPSVPLDEVAAPQLPEWSNGQLLKAFFRTADRGFESRSSSGASRRQRVRQRNQVVERHPPRQEHETGAGGRRRGLEPRQPSHPALRSPSTRWW